ncbi:hypothetical protein [Streptococcus cuniculi]|uniref:Uncharacterized protein n=1 Tax=Streptococcus cuniculi TaxID=1432788 RepID=A0A4Y9J827_9STRE|nr:hypothetical protein [Streptococcus cuniculi]MBF0779030.1 hypothetical protein [Streptococcus cuniculi]TFU96997.1 hypothetical protein E4T82_09955 [Streptococcus cuniculi]
MSTSVTNSSVKRIKKISLTYLSLILFLFLFSRIYESLSYGEVSFFMHYLFAVPLIGGSLLLLAFYLFPQLSRLSFNLWNSGVAVLTAGFLLRGIINLSGRSTTLDLPYWYIGGCLLLLTILSLFLSKTKAPV